MPDFRHIVNTHYKLAFNFFQQFGQLVKIGFAEDSFAVVVFAVPVRRVEVKQRVRPVIAGYKLLIWQAFNINAA